MAPSTLKFNSNNTQPMQKYDDSIGSIYRYIYSDTCKMVVVADMHIIEEEYCPWLKFVLSGVPFQI